MTDIAARVSKVAATIYHWVPVKYRSAIYGIVSLAVTSLCTLIAADLTKVHTDNPYVAILLVAGVGLFHILVNIVQQKMIEFGTKLLAEDGNQRVMNSLEDKLAATQTLIRSGQ